MLQITAAYFHSGTGTLALMSRIRGAGENAYKPKRVSDSKLNTVGEENHLLVSDIVKTSVWSGVRYQLPAEASSNNDVAHS